VGRLAPHLIRPVRQKDPSKFMKVSYMKELDMEMWAKWNTEVTGKYFYNIPSQSTIDIAEMKMDRKVVLEYDSIKDYAISIVDQVLEPALTHLAWTDEEVYDHIDMTKGPSVPMKYMGFKTRQDYAMSDHWIAVKDDILSLQLLQVIYASVPKEEFASMEDWMKKSRTFCVPGFHVLFWQAKCFGQGNINLKKNWWSKYGFSPFGGGTKSLYEAMEQRKKDGTYKYPVRISWDAEGYDRVVSLHNVADRRHRCFCKANPIELHKFSAWITRGLKLSMIILSNGDVVWRVTGNNSGSGMTTTNNIEAGMEIIADVLCYVYKLKKHRLPSFRKIVDQMVSLFGDDNMSALSKSFSLILDQQLISDRLMRMHGMKLKFFVGGYELPLNRLTFLGFTMVKFRNQILPQWDLSRLLLPITYSKDKLDPEKFVQRFYAILVLAYAHKQWDELRIDYLKCLNILKDKIGSPMVKMFVLMGAPTDMQLQYFYSGLEFGGGGPFRNTKMADIEIYDDSPLGFETLVDKIIERFEYDVERIDREGPGEYPVICDCVDCKAHENAHIFYRDVIGVDNKGDLEFIRNFGLTQWEIDERLRAKKIYEQHNGDVYEPNPFYELSSDKEEPLEEDDILDIQNMSDRLYDFLKPSFIQLVPRKIFCDCSECKETLRVSVEAIKMIEKNQSHKIIPLNQSANNSKAGEGTFNAYGNEQMAAQFTLTKPSFQNVGNMWTCVSTCLLPSPINIIGTGATNAEAFVDWHNQVDVYVDSWAPVDMTPVVVFVRTLRTLKVEKGHPLYGIVSATDEGEAVNSFWKTFMEGSFNKYGNGQPVLTYAKWVQSRGSAVVTMTEAQRKAAYKKYLNKKPRAQKGGVPPPRVRQPRNLGQYKVSPPKARSTGVEKRAEIKLSGCAKGYAVALKCPFWFKDRSCSNKVMSLKVNPEMNPCIPMFPAIKTRKFYANASGTFGAPNGFEAATIVFAPWRMANDNSLINDVAPAILYTRSSIGGAANAFPICDTGSPWGNGAANLNTDYNTASLVNVGGVGIKYRVVGAGLRIKYTGNMVNASGIIAAVEQSDHETLGGLTLDQVGQLDSYFSVSVVSAMEKKEDPWTYLTYTPVAMDDFDFNSDTIANATWPVNGNKNHFIGAILSGIPTGGDFFSWEAIVHYEAIGQAVRGKTDTPADPMGTASVLNTIKPETQKKNNTPEPIKSSLKEGAADMSLSGMVNAAVSVAKEILPIANSVV